MNVSSNSQPVANLNYTQALVLLGLPGGKTTTPKGVLFPCKKKPYTCKVS
ncbi:MAG: DUF3102 domain-containing protein [Dehalobacter sp.]|nr:DUF3102 domain-containing protein [Dehalobacter sp.]